MISHVYIPKYPLDQFVESFFYYAGYNPEHAVDRFLPDGNVHIIFDLTETPKFIYDNDSLKEIQSCRKVWFSGFRTEPITIPSGRESEMLIVNFIKGASYPFVADPLDQLTNYVVDAELVLKNEILQLREEICEAATIESKFRTLETNLLSHYENEFSINPFVKFMVSRIAASPTILSLREVADQVGYSPKHMIKLFRQHVGVTPKEFLKVMRFQHAINEIEKTNKVNWASTAIDSGYYDQSHFIADFKHFSGFTPARYLKLRGETVNYVPVL